LWVLGGYLGKLREKEWKGKTIAYFPVDAAGYSQEWIKTLYDFDKVLVYTKWAEGVLREATYKGNIGIVPHGIDTNTYFPIPKQEARSKLAGIEQNDFIVLNGN
jgi:hypothetical protein